MTNKPWIEAIKIVLAEADGPQTRNEIAEAIAEKNLRSKVGATPANTVVAYIGTSLKKSGEKSPFIRVGRGQYWLRSKVNDEIGASEIDSDSASREEETLINSFGMYWERDKVNWKKSSPELLGIEQEKAVPVNFCNQAGVYILYDRYRPIYVGRATKDRLGQRLRYHHVMSRFKGRWNRFSWFGLCGTDAKGKLQSPSVPSDSDAVIAAMEALLIESLEPVQNRKRGDGFNAQEYFQAEDQELKKQEFEQQLFSHLVKKNAS